MKTESAQKSVPAPASQAAKTVSQAAKTVAVIDIGTSAIRMAIAEISPEGDIRRLETLSQDVNLGRDTFTKGMIEKATIEQCVRILASYRQLLSEYQISQSDQIRVVATSAVREAANRLAFLDRIYIATGLLVEPTDEAEVSRITYLGIQPHLRGEKRLADATALVVEVGGGSTEVLVVRRGEVVSARTTRLGSLRLRETLEAYRAPTAQLRSMMDNQIRRAAAEIARDVGQHDNLDMIAMGGDIRFAARQLRADDHDERLVRLKAEALQTFVGGVLEMTVDELVHKYHLTFSQAETLGPALLAYVRLTEALGLKQIYVSHVSFRDGLLMEMVASQRWSEDFTKPVIQSALELSRKYCVDEKHARHVAELAKRLFHELQAEHQLGARDELILYVAALLHEIGRFVSPVSHHKHTLYLISNSELFGLRAEDVVLVGLVARYHRRASPKPSHVQYAALDRQQRIAVAKLGAILRVADALDRSRSQRIEQFSCRRDDDRLVISVPQVDDLSLEQLALREKGALFEEIFGVPVLLRRANA